MAPPSWRAPLAAALVLLASSLLAGCVGTAAASAAELRNDADAAAQKWDANAVLAQAIGVEGTFPLADFVAGEGYGGAGGSSAAAEQTKGDENVGDGKCEAWIYRYVAEGREEAYVVIVGANGKILHEETDELRDDDVPLGAWTIDSDAAMAAAIEANEGLRKGLEQANFGFVAVLGAHESSANPAWLIAGGGGSSVLAGGGFAVVDAVTGEVLFNQGGFFGR